MLKVQVLVAGVLVAVLSSSKPALGATSYLPVFSPSQEVYIDPLMSRADAPVDLAGLQEKLKNLEQVHGLEFAFIAAQNTDRVGDTSNEQVAQQGLASILNRWAGEPSFPKENYVVVYWLRRGDNVRKGTFLGDAGTELKAYNINKNFFTEISSDILPEYMPSNPAGAATAYFERVNKEIQIVQDFNKFLEGLPKMARNLFFVLLPLGVVYFLLYKLFEYAAKRRSAKAEADALFSDISGLNVSTCDQVQSIQQQLKEIEAEHGEKIKCWTDKAKGDYETLVQLYNQLSHMFVLLAEIYKEAENLVNKPFKLVYLLSEQTFNYDSEMNDYLGVMGTDPCVNTGYSLSTTYPRLKSHIYTTNKQIQSLEQQVQLCLKADQALANAKKTLEESLNQATGLVDIGTHHIIVNDMKSRYLQLEPSQTEPYKTLDLASIIITESNKFERMLSVIQIKLNLNADWEKAVHSLTQRHKLVSGYEDDQPAKDSIKLLHQLLKTHKQLLQNTDIAQAEKVEEQISKHLEGWESFLNEVQNLSANMYELHTKIVDLYKSLETSDLPNKDPYMSQLKDIGGKLENTGTMQTYNNQLSYMECYEKFRAIWHSASKDLAEHRKRLDTIKRLQNKLIADQAKLKRRGVKTRTKDMAGKLEDEFWAMHNAATLQELTAMEVAWDNTVRSADSEHSSYSSSSSYSGSSYSSTDYSSSSFGGGDYGGGSFGGGSY